MTTDLTKFQATVADAAESLREAQVHLKRAGMHVAAADPLAVAAFALDAQIEAANKTIADLGNHLSHRILFGKES